MHDAGLDLQAVVKANPLSGHYPTKTPKKAALRPS